MTKENYQILMAYCSPYGNTRRVADSMKKKIDSFEIPVSMVELTKSPDIDSIYNQLTNKDVRICLYIGSPVYASHPVPPVMEFIERLPIIPNAYSVPFVTWGAVTSGVALYEMGVALADRGYPVIGAAKVTAQHSMMWEVDLPLGNLRPNDEDETVLVDLVSQVNNKLRSEIPNEVSISDLDYQEDTLRQQMLQRSFEAAKSHFPQKNINPEHCTLCGICVENCPVNAIELVDVPMINKHCIYCYNCVRLCPELAITADLTNIHDFIRQRALSIKESTAAQVYL